MEATASKVCAHMGCGVSVVYSTCWMQFKLYDVCTQILNMMLSEQ